MKRNKIYLYPVWLRAWHWINAILFFNLIISGINLQYSGEEAIILDFDTAILLHNVSGITLTVNYLLFIIGNILTGNWRQYLPRPKGYLNDAKKQAQFYISGIFKGEDHPFETTQDNKFNPLQKTTYLLIMYAMFPLVLITGWALLFPEFIFEEIFGMSGLFSTAILHTSLGFFMSLFMIGHIYLATTGHTPTANFKSMVTGWHHE